MKIPRLLYRSWYYFREGYSTYLTFLVGAGNFVVASYYLAIKSIPALQAMFPSFTLFVVTAVCVGIPIAVLIGWLHLKQAPLWTAELDVRAEANVYNYKLRPGYELEAYGPYRLLILRQMARLLEKEQMLSEEEREKIRDIEGKLETLIRGGYVGKARRRL